MNQLVGYVSIMHFVRGVNFPAVSIFHMDCSFHMPHAVNIYRYTPRVSHLRIVCHLP